MQQYSEKRNPDEGVVSRCKYICGFIQPNARGYNILNANCANIAEEIWEENTGEQISTTLMSPPKCPMFLKDKLNELNRIDGGIY